MKKFIRRKRSKRTEKKEYTDIDKGRSTQYMDLAAQSVLMGACLSLLLTMSGEAVLIPWAIPGVAVFAFGSYFRDTDRLPVRKAALVIAAVLFLSGLLLHSLLIGGVELILNHLYAIGEQSQAYLYDRFEIEMDEVQQSRAMRATVVWMSVMGGSLMALLKGRIRRWVPAGLMTAIFGAFAFMGLVPMAMPMGVLLAAAAVAAVEGRIRSAFPLFILLAVVFGGVLIADPGENHQVSRIDEQLRDYLAMSTVRLEGMEIPQQDQLEGEGAGEDEEEGGTSDQQELQEMIQNRLGYIIGLMLLIALILFVPAVIVDRLKKKRQKNRAGIDDPDNRIAIRAMFPYAVRWLRADGMTIGNRTYVSLLPQVRERFEKEYAGKFDRMLQLWREAAYSDHAMSDDDRSEMTDFIFDTMVMINARSSRKDRLKIRYIYAL